MPAAQTAEHGRTAVAACAAAEQTGSETAAEMSGTAEGKYSLAVGYCREVAAESAVSSSSYASEQYGHVQQGALGITEGHHLWLFQPMISNVSR